MTLEGTIKHGVELEAGAESDSTLELTLHGGLRVTLASCDCDEVVIAFGPIGSYVDMSGYYTRAQTDTLLSGKADKATTYTKAEVDEMISHVDIDMDDAPTEGSGNAVSSGGVFTALSGKVDKQAGKGLSSNDYTDAEKTKLASVASGAEANVQSDWSQSDSSADDYIKNKPTIPTVPSNVSAFTNDAGYLTEHQSLGNYYTKSEINSALGSKQDTLVSGTNIKTLNGQSLVGGGNVAIQIPPAPPEPLLVYMTGSGGTYSLDKEVFDIEDALSDNDELECYLVWDGNNPAVVRLRCYGYNVEETIGGHSQSCIVWSGLDNIGNRHIVKAYHDSTNDVDMVNYSVASPDGRGITSIVKTATVGLVDTYTITYSDGTTSTYTVTNGKDGQNGRDGQDGQDGADGVSLGEVALVQTTGDSTESVMSQKAVTDYGRKVTAEDLNGTSDWIKAKLTDEGWEFGKALNTTGGTGNDASCCVTGYIPVESVNTHNLTFNTQSGNMYQCWYNDSKTFIKTDRVNNNASWKLNNTVYDNAKYIRLTLSLSKINIAYLKDNTTGEYIFNGNDYLNEFNVSVNDGNVSYDFFANNLLLQEIGDNPLKVMSQKATNDAIEAAPLRKMRFNNYAVFGESIDKACTSVDTYDIDELKVITSLRVCDTFNTGSPSYYNHSLQHILGIASATNPNGDYLSIYGESYNLYLRFVKNGTNVLNYSLGSSNGRKILRTFARLDLYGKTVSLYSKGGDGTYLTILENYDISGLDLSNLQRVKIVTSVGNSHRDKTLFNHVQINNYIIDPKEQLDTVVNYGEYSTKSSMALTTKPQEPTTFMFTNEGNATGINVTLNDPYHKIVEVNRDTAGLVYNIGFYTMNNSPTNIRSNAYEIFKVKFTNVESDLLIRGWSENGGSNYILDPETYTYTKIPMDSSTGTVLEYPIEEGKTYFIIYAIGGGYSTRYNHYFGGHFTMEITEPKLYCQGAMNLCAEYYDGQYFCGHIPFKSSVIFIPEIHGQFDSAYNLPAMKGRMRIDGYGAMQIYDGTVWKRINNS